MAYKRIMSIDASGTATIDRLIIANQKEPMCMCPECSCHSIPFCVKNCISKCCCRK